MMTVSEFSEPNLTAMERWGIRIGFATAAAGAGFVAWGSFGAGTSPSWPVGDIYGVLAAAAAVCSVWAAVANSTPWRAMTLFVIAATAFTRAIGWALFPSDRLGFNPSAIGGWVLASGAVILAGAYRHIMRGRRDDLRSD